MLGVTVERIFCRVNEKVQFSRSCTEQEVMGIGAKSLLSDFGLFLQVISGLKDLRQCVMSNAAARIEVILVQTSSSALVQSSVNTEA